MCNYCVNKSVMFTGEIRQICRKTSCKMISIFMLHNSKYVIHINKTVFLRIIFLNDMRHTFIFTSKRKIKHSILWSGLIGKSCLLGNYSIIIQQLGGELGEMYSIYLFPSNLIFPWPVYNNTDINIINE